MGWSTALTSMAACILSSIKDESPDDIIESARSNVIFGPYHSGGLCPVKFPLKRKRSFLTRGSGRGFRLGPIPRLSLLPFDRVRRAAPPPSASCVISDPAVKLGCTCPYTRRAGAAQGSGRRPRRFSADLARAPPSVRSDLRLPTRTGQSQAFSQSPPERSNADAIAKPEAALAGQ
jgi:hypothetical protein